MCFSTAASSANFAARPPGPSPFNMTGHGWSGTLRCPFRYRCPSANNRTSARACWQCSRTYCLTTITCGAKSQRARAEGTDAYSLLAAIGHDCVGALQFLPADLQPTPAGAIDAVPVSRREISAILDNLASAPLGITEDGSFRISIAGAQAKTALLRWNRRWCKPRGTTATTHIFKPSIGRLPNGVDLRSSVENEYLCLKIVNALGLPVAHAEMETFGDRRVLIVERFDRLWTADQRLLRLPQEDSCQALSVPPTLKYESDGGLGITDILKLLRGSDEPLSDQRAFLKANIVFWLIGATDGHAKNFSIFLSPGGPFA